MKPRFPLSHRACYQRPKDETASQSQNRYGDGLVDRRHDHEPETEPAVSSRRDPAVLVDAGQPASLSHEAEITGFHVALRAFLPPDTLYWKQSDIKRTVNPDALFAIREGNRAHWFFLEVERSRQGNQRDGRSGLERKCERYGRYRGSEQCRKDYQHFRDFRLVIVFATEERQVNFLGKLAKTLPARWIWTTNETAYRENAGGTIYRTPHDFSVRRYSLSDIHARKQADALPS